VREGLSGTGCQGKALAAAAPKDFLSKGGQTGHRYIDLDGFLNSGCLGGRSAMGRIRRILCLGLGLALAGSVVGAAEKSPPGKPAVVVSNEGADGHVIADAVQFPSKADVDALAAKVEPAKVDPKPAKVEPKAEPVKVDPKPVDPTKIAKKETPKEEPPKVEPK